MKEFVSKIVRGNFPLCFEKARLITESHKQTEGEPAIIRYAMAQANVLENFPLIIYRDELFVGEGASRPWGAEIDPLLGIWKEDAIRAQWKMGLSRWTMRTGQL
jgi:pyruvate-formate lyase